MLVLIFVGPMVFLAIMAWRLRGNVAHALVESAARRLPDERRDWGRAMLSELEAIDGAVARLRFGLGCTRVALVPPTPPGSARRSRNVAIAIGCSALTLALYVRLRLDGTSYPDSTQHDAPYEVAIWLSVFALFVSYVAVALVRLRATTPRAMTARRYGVVSGVLSGVIVLLACSPALIHASDSDPLSLVPNGWLFLLALTVPLVLATAAARATGQPRAGIDAGWWSGVIAGAIVVVGLLIFTVTATHWFVHSPATLAAYRSYWPPRGTHQTHFRNITAFLLNANLGGAAMIGVLAMPALSYLLGAAGVAVGFALPTRRLR